VKIAGVEFPERLLNALRDGRLVVFAGAGVSMGQPAGLPDFKGLASRVARGTTLTIGEVEREDEFLGRLNDHGTDVHRRAAHILQADDPEPTAMHRNLLRFYADPENVRMVVTNFDLLFEKAAGDIFNSPPAVFEAPTLPPGRSFKGLVHIHGSVKDPGAMVLTDRDFGQAYLTGSDGWASRFVFDLLTNNTVLFVGYSHSDVMMTYVARALPANDTQNRFALIGDQTDDPNHWIRMGIQPILFHQSDTSDFDGLDAAVAQLANHRRLTLLDWRHKIATIAAVGPPVSDEGAGVIEHALTDPVMTRFFVETAELPEWVEWLDRRGRLTALFTDGELSQQHQTLVEWLVLRFAITHDGALFELIGRYGHRLNPRLWRQLCWQLLHSIRESPDEAVITRWVLCLASVIPSDADEAALAWLGEACASVRATDSLWRVYYAMTARLDRAPPLLGWRSSELFHHYLSELLSKHIKPNLPEMAEPLLALTTMRLNARHAVSTAWDEGDATWHWDNLNRSAIEPHEQDDRNLDIDPLIDTARECLEWLAVHGADVARRWSENSINSPSPLLRRLAIHTLSARTDLSTDEKIDWMLENCDIHAIATHHEIYRAVRFAYPQASSERRSDFINAVLAFRWPDQTESENDRYAAYHHLQWLHWLSAADTSCDLAMQAIADIQIRYPEYRPSEHPDFTHYHWSGTRSLDQSSWTVEALLARPATEILPDLLAYQPTDQQRLYGDDRGAMLRRVEEAAQVNSSWGLELADALAGAGERHSDLWSHLIVAWTTADLDGDGIQRALSHLSVDALQRQHTWEIANILCVLAGKANSSEATDLSYQANSIAVALHQYAVQFEAPNLTAYVGGVPQETDWASRAIGHPSGKLAEYWVQRIDRALRQQESSQPSLNDQCRDALDTITQESDIAGKLGRTILARNLPFLLYVDETWALRNLVPLLEPGHSDFAAAWDGVTHYESMTPRATELLREPFLKAIERINSELSGSRKQRFVATYIAMFTWFAARPTDEWITKLFTYGDTEVRHQFAAEIRHHLRSLDETRQSEWWSGWLKDYWENRLQGVPAPLDDTEVVTMLDWTTLLSAVYPQAVDVAVQMRAVPLQRGTIIYGIGQTELVNQYPEAVAKFLIHLGEADQKPWIWHGAKEICDELLQSHLDGEIEVRLRETVAKIGLR